jgi:hypothetical protein
MSMPIIWQHIDGLRGDITRLEQAFRVLAERVTALEQQLHPGEGEGEEGGSGG